MATNRQKAITEYINSRCTDRQFTPLEIAVIETQKDAVTRHRDREPLNRKSKSGKQIINQRIADRVNDMMAPKIPVTSEHIRLYKRCWADEYSDRTGKCAWGFADIRVRLGYDPKTGLEII